MNKKMLVLGMILVLLATLFIAALPNVSATEYKHVQLENTDYGGKPYKASWDNLLAGSIIMWDWYAEEEGLLGVDPAYIYFWIEDGNGNELITPLQSYEEVGEYTVKSSGKYVVIWEYNDEDAWEEDIVDLYLELKAKKPPANDDPIIDSGNGNGDDPIIDSGNGNGDDSTPGFEIVGLIAGISIAMVLVANKKRR